MNTLERNINKARFYSSIQLSIKLSSGILIFIFGFLKFSNLPIQQFLNPVIKDYIVKLAMFIYFSAWIFGGSSDLNLHKKIHDHVRINWEIKKWVYPFLLGLLIVFGLLCYIQDVKSFVIMLLIFRIIDVVGLRFVINNYIKNKDIDSFFNSKDITTSLARHYFINLYNGKWRKIRAIFDISSALVLLIILFLNPVLNYLAGFDFPIIELTLFSLILLSELWLFAIRFKTHVSINVLTELEGQLSK